MLNRPVFIAQKKPPPIPRSPSSSLVSRKPSGPIKADFARAGMRDLGRGGRGFRQLYRTLVTLMKAVPANGRLATAAAASRKGTLPSRRRGDDQLQLKPQKQLANVAC